MIWLLTVGGAVGVALDLIALSVFCLTPSVVEHLEDCYRDDTRYDCDPDEWRGRQW